MDKVTQAELALVGLGILALLIFSGYEFFEHKEIVEAVVSSPVVIEGAVGAGIVEDVEIIESLVGDGREATIKKYLEIEGGHDSFVWWELLGADVYNDGFGSFHARMLQENAEHLAKKFGAPREYLMKVGVVGMTRGDGGISPFWTRQHLESLPFSGDLHGAFGSSAGKLKSEIWTDWDRITEWVSNYPKYEAKITKMQKEDIDHLERLEREGSWQAWIVRDRVLSWHQVIGSRVK